MNRLKRKWIYLVMVILLINTAFTGTIANAATPSAVNDAYAMVNNGTPLTITQLTGVLANDPDAVVGSGQNLIITKVSNVTNGTISLNSVDGSFTYTPFDGFSGIDSFTYSYRIDTTTWMDMGCIPTGPFGGCTSMPPLMTTTTGTESNIATVTITVDSPIPLDTDGPTVSSAIPAEHGKVAVDSDIVINFNEAILAGSHIGDATLMNGSTVTSFVYEVHDSVLTIDPEDDLAYASSYTLTLPAASVTDLVYNPLATEFILNFTTLSQPLTMPPQNLAAVAGDRQVMLNWDTVTGATYYNVYMSTTSNDYGGTPLVTVTDATYGVHNLTNNTIYYFDVQAANTDYASANSSQVSATPVSVSNEHEEDNSTPETPSSTETSGVEVLVNGKVENLGTTQSSQRNEQSVTTVIVDQKKLEAKLAEEGQHAVVTIPVNDKADVVIGELNGQLVKNMEDKQAILEIRTERATYTLPASQINIDALSNQFGQSVDLQDIKIRIEIAAPTSDVVERVENAGEKGDFQIVVPPTEFKIQGVYGNTTVDISKFNNYVERSIAIPDGVNPQQISTGVVIEPDGTVRHVPTRIANVDGQYYAQINSLTNSTYSVIWHPTEFKDAADHWAKDAINNIGSRLIINGTGDAMFSPDQDMTRAEFADVMVRALGLKLENSEGTFTDVKATDAANSGIVTAYAYGLINGFEDGTFRPNDKITREQVMVVIAKAMMITELKAKLDSQLPNVILQPYQDATDISTWAQSSFADSVQAGIVEGRNDRKLAPKAYMTRAEVTTIMERLLQKSGLI